MSKIKDIIKYFYYIGILILVIFLILNHKSCEDKLIKELIKPSKDTIDFNIKVKSDTIYIKDTILSFKYIKIPIPKIDTLYKVVYLDSGACNRIYVYEDSLKDTNISIYYKDYIQGILRNKNISYKLKVPIKIIDSITTIITISKKPTFEFTGGFVAGKGIISPNIEIGLKRHKIGLGYNLISKSPNFSYKYTFFTK